MRDLLGGGVSVVDGSEERRSSKTLAADWLLFLGATAGSDLFSAGSDLFIGLLAGTTVGEFKKGVDSVVMSSSPLSSVYSRPSKGGVVSTLEGSAVKAVSRS